jgi:hypothetical protein
MIFGSIIISSPIQDFPYGFSLSFAAEPDSQQPISFTPNIQASRLPKLALIGFVFSPSPAVKISINLCLKELNVILFFRKLALFFQPAFSWS